MDKRIIANRRVRQRMVEALLTLMETKRFSEISVTDIVTQAGVARQSYYRNFSSKDAILEEFYAGIRAQVLENLGHPHTVGIRHLILTILQVLKEHQSQILQLYHAGFAKLNLEMIDQYIEDAAGDMPARSPLRYQIYCFAGAFFHVGLVWLSGGAKESAEEIAEIILSFRAQDLHFNVSAPISEELSES